MNLRQVAVPRQQGGAQDREDSLITVTPCEGMPVTDYRELLAYSDADFAQADPLVMNLLVAKSIPSLAHLDIPRYVQLRDSWAEGVQKRLPYAEKVFRRTPEDWRNDINFLRLAVLCEYLDCEAGIAYREDQRDVKSINYTDPSDLFLNGVMDTRRGTCGNMAALHVAIGWRLGWPVSLACVKSHLICRYDDGKVTHNIEATDTGRGGFSSRSDEQSSSTSASTVCRLSRSAAAPTCAPSSRGRCWACSSGSGRGTCGTPTSARKRSLTTSSLDTSSRPAAGST